jgi:hypothetical protein
MHRDVLEPQPGPPLHTSGRDGRSSSHRIQMSRCLGLSAHQVSTSATISDEIDLTRLPGQVEIGTAWLGMSRVAANLARQAG